jgi:cbb3-type cytochrome oxidase subunit 3
VQTPVQITALPPYPTGKAVRWNLWILDVIRDKLTSRAAERGCSPSQLVQELLWRALSPEAEALTVRELARAALIPALGLVAFALLLGVVWWLNRRDRRWAAEAQRRWELQDQVWAMERQIWDEQLSDEEREWRRQYREQQAEVRREARRRSPTRPGGGPVCGGRAPLRMFRNVPLYSGTAAW